MRMLLNTYGLQRVAERLEQLILPSIRIRTQRVHEELLSLGASKFGGLPDLPPEIAWPSWKSIPMAFLAQINLKETQTLDTMKVLPSSGMLYFFYDAYHQPVGYDPTMRGGWCVFYYDGPCSSLQRLPIPSLLLEKPSLWLPKEQHYTACAVTFSLEPTFPPNYTVALEALSLSDEEQEGYSTFLRLGKEDVQEPIHRLLGHPDALQGDMQVESQLVSHGLYAGDGTAYVSPRAEQLKKGVQNWRLLLQLDTDDKASMLWGIEGRIYYWIEVDALRTRHFEQSWMIMQWT